MSPEAWGAVGLIGAAVSTGLFGLCVAAVTSRRTKGIEAQLKPNGGASMHDLLNHVAHQVNIIEANQGNMASDVRAVIARQGVVIEDVRNVRANLDAHIAYSEQWKSALLQQGINPPAA